MGIWPAWAEVLLVLAWDIRGFAAEITIMFHNKEMLSCVAKTKPWLPPKCCQPLKAVHIKLSTACSGFPGVCRVIKTSTAGHHVSEACVCLAQGSIRLYGAAGKLFPCSASLCTWISCLPCWIWWLCSVHDVLLCLGMATKAQSINATRANPLHSKPRGWLHLNPWQGQQQRLLDWADRVSWLLFKMKYNLPVPGR